VRKIQRPLLRVTFRALGALPLPLRQALGRVLGRAVAIFSITNRRIIKLQTKLALGQSPDSIAYDSYAQLGQTFFESLNLNPVLKEDSRIRVVTGEEIIQRYSEQHRPLVALTGHVGNWDLLAAYIVKRGIKLCTVARRARNSTLHEILEDIRKSYGVKTLWRSGTAGQEVISALKNKNVVAALIDQDTRVRSEAVPFFGFPAATPNGLVSIAKKKGIEIVSAFLIRLKDGSFDVYVRKIDHNLSEAQILTTFNSHLEEIIREHPDQWVWFHKRWRTKPDGTRPSSADYIAFLESEAQRTVATD